MNKEPLVNRDFVEKFFRSVDRPLEYGVYFLFHEWWAEAPQSAIDGYMAQLASTPGAEDFIAKRHLAEPLSLDDLAGYAPGTLGHAYRAFIVDNDLEANLARNYRDFNAELSRSGKLDRLPEDLSYMIVRGFQIHDFLHVITGHDSTPMGELGMAAFHFAQLRYPYHAMRMAVTTAHLAFLNPTIIEDAMDAITRGWMMGRACPNLHFRLWEEELDVPLDGLRKELGLADTPRAA